MFTDRNDCCVMQVSDYGLSRKLNQNQTHVSNARQGTPHYIAPEVVMHGEPESSIQLFQRRLCLSKDIYGFFQSFHKICLFVEANLG